MNTNQGDPNPKDPEITYFDDFIRKIEKEYPYASWCSVMEEVQFARQAGPILAQLRPIGSGTYELIMSIGFGHKALIEFEFDRSGTLQPVLGGIIKD